MHKIKYEYLREKIDAELIIIEKDDEFYQNTIVQIFRLLVLCQDQRSLESLKSVYFPSQILLKRNHVRLFYN